MRWWIPQNACTCQSETAEVEAGGNALTAQFTVPADARPGDRLVVNLEVRDVAARSMTRFAQFFIDITA